MLRAETRLPDPAASGRFRWRIDAALAANDRLAIAEQLRRCVRVYDAALTRGKVAAAEEAESRVHFLRALDRWAECAVGEERGEDWTRFDKDRPADRREPNAERARRLYVASGYDLRNTGLRLAAAEARVKRCARMLEIATTALGLCVGSARGVR